MKNKLDNMKGIEITEVQKYEETTVMCPIQSAFAEDLR